jgi:hypothetical protein
VVRQIPGLFGMQTRVAILGGKPLLVPWAVSGVETAHIDQDSCHEHV